MAEMVVRRRRDKRIWYLVLGMFVMVFLFTFLSQNFKSLDEEADAASLANFDPGYIISDYQMGNYNSMNEAEIQAFLKSKNSCNDTNLGRYTYGNKVDYYSETTPYTWHVTNGHFVCMADEVINGETAAHIICQAAQDYRINPQVLIVVLQKEQGMVTDTFPHSIQYRSAMGYGCPDTAPCSPSYAGFRNQVRNAASMFRTVLDGGWTNYPVGDNYIQYNPSASCGGSVVNINNRATSALYRYTPYQPNAGALAAGYGTAYCGAYGNRNLYLYFEDWFGGVTSEGEIDAPSNIKVEEVNNEIEISWSEPRNITQFNNVEYEIVLARKDKKTFSVVLGSESTSYRFKNLESGVYYAASVKAISASSSRYDRVTFEIAVGDEPDAPTNVVPMVIDGDEIEISWDVPNEDGRLKIERYEVVIAGKKDGERKKIVEGDVYSVRFYDLGEDEYYAASVKALNAKGGKYTRVVFSFNIPMTLVEMLKLNKASSDENYTGFVDMPNDEISKRAVSWAVYSGITDKNEYFNGESALTRRQAMVILWRIRED